MSEAGAGSVNGARADAAPDYIVIGAGSAGSAVAGRLSESGCATVLLLEAGGRNDQFVIRQPALSLLKAIGDDRFDWKLRAEPDASRHGKQSLVHRGKGLGGSSAINGMVYFRGDRSDYDHWAQLGNRGWGWAEVLPAFMRMERGLHHDPETFGQDGPISVEPPRTVHPLSRAFVDAGLAMGLPANPGLVAPDTHGVGLADATQRRGERMSAGRAYLHPAARRSGLAIWTETEVVRILFDGRRATGVLLRRGGEEQVVAARRGIILCAGAVHSPAILMRSGLGPARDLAAFGIAPVHDLPGVGENLQDHVETALVYRARRRTVNQETNLLWQAWHGLRWLLDRRGPAASAGADALAMVKSRPGLEAADILFYFGPYIAGLEEAGVAFSREAGMTLDVGLMRPRVRGRIGLRSPAPGDQPRIYYDLLGDAEDVATIVRGVRLAESLMRQPPIAAHVAGRFAPDRDFASDGDIVDHVRAVARPSLHLCGTCRMGDDAMAVVDARLNVHGVEGLRVADASIMPTIPACNLNAPSIMIGERAADFVREDGGA